VNDKPTNTKRSFNIRNLYLDPNNYRFLDNGSHVQISGNKILDPRIQQRTRGFIEGYKLDSIKDLLASFKANGFLDVDVIQVKDLGNNKYLVLEGNRRVTALKNLQEDYDKGLDIGNLDPSIFKSLPFQIHDNEDNEKHLIVMGLKHISGNKKWSTINQAQLIHDFLEPFRLQGREQYINKENSLCNSLGISKIKLRTMQRVFHFIIAYKNSDYGDQFESSKYGMFEEIIKKPIIKEWLSWNDDNYLAENRINLGRLFSWISKTEVLDSENDDHENEYEELEPIITKSLEIRDLALFIDNENALEVMEKEKSLAQGLMASGTVDRQNYQQALK